ncbi:hypothetical protein ES703_92307 [subsurface metagenome]
MSNQLYSEIAKNTKGEKILLIGSSGNIGGKALEILLKHGKASSITAFDKKEPKIKELPASVKVLSGDEADITNADTVKNGMKGNTIVVCAIGVPRFTAPGEKKLTPYEIEQDGVQNIVDAAKKEGVKQIIYISALGVARGDKIPKFHIAHLAKRNAENILKKSDISYTILRPSGYFFDFRDLLAAAVAGRYHVVEGSKAKMQPLHQDDMSTILIASINNTRTKNKIIPVGGSEIFSFDDLGKLFGKVLEKEVEIIRLAPDHYKKEYFNSDVILFRATSDSILTKRELDTLQAAFPGLSLGKLGDYLNNPSDPMLKAFFQKA